MHDPSWDDLRVFLATARAGSFTRAADALGIQQSTVSRRIASLEASLGGAVFLRSRGGVTLTSRGAALWAGATDVERAAADALRAAAHVDAEVSGWVRVATSPGLASQWLAPRLTELSAAHPRLQVELVVHTTIADLSRDEADLALRFAQPRGEDLVARRLGALGYAVLAHPRWRDTAWSELAWVEWTVAGWTSPESQWTARHAARPPVLRTRDYDSALAATRAGLGAMVGSEALADGVGLIVLPPAAPLPSPADLWLVGHAATRASARVDAVWRAVVRWFDADLRARATSG
jgi:DNA-binding transcriptional LysR family regulator